MGSDGRIFEKVKRTYTETELKLERVAARREALVNVLKYLTSGEYCRHDSREIVQSHIDKLTTPQDSGKAASQPTGTPEERER